MRAGRARILSWNVNGLRACAKKGFRAWLRQSGAEIVGVQEVRARIEQLPGGVGDPEGWHSHFVEAERPGYSGVGLYSRRAPDRIHTDLGRPRFDRDVVVPQRFGPVVNLQFPELALLEDVIIGSFQ